MQTGGFTGDFRGLAQNIDTCLKMLASGKQVVINPIITFEVKKLGETECPFTFTKCVALDLI